MSSPALSDILQNDAEILEKQWQEIQRRHEEEQQLLAQLEEAAKLHWAERAAQKARREAEAKAKEENDGVPPAAPGRGARGRSCPNGGG